MKRQSAQSVRKPTTFRLEPDVQEGLLLLARLVEAPLNRLVNEAVRMFVRKRTTEIATNMEETLKLLKARRAKDPNFERAISEFADSEASYAKEDPAEGEVEQKHGPMQTRVHDLLNRAS